MGTSLAFVGAYVLAGELRAAGGDHRVALLPGNGITEKIALKAANAITLKYY